MFNFQAHTPMVVECCHCILMVCMTFNTGALFLQVFLYCLQVFILCRFFIFLQAKIALLMHRKSSVFYVPIYAGG